ncbi:endoribonuclease L-PSP [Pseudothauera nasutitermitis]|uniref:Endoribonuclease L-PSP n=1 Tax=Pseudothauera nasutitermitis TaxID=2565930 RepID=A0A4S4AZK7_9RHOO|nr:endoribonuclease L-PSP [Pseudothauera nasutitermitis]THF65591.1 endoribonuclease L-PSP [Pseudothauera nasutitermitis]
MPYREASNPSTGEDSVRHLYAVASPLQGNSSEEQLAEAVARISNEFSAKGGFITNQTVFLRDPDQIESIERRLATLHGEGKIPATSYINQAPCEPRSLLAIEAVGITGAKVEYHGPHATLVHHDGITWIQTAHRAPVPGKTGGAYDHTLHTLTHTRRMLEGIGADIGQVVRTWFYVGGITSDDLHSVPVTQRYKELNRARSDFFRNIDFLANRVPKTVGHTVYPASTGIGMAGEEIRLSTLALLTQRSDVVTVPLENPRQTAAFDYARHYSPQSPKFSRAMAVVNGNQAITYVSGTASITASETRHAGDAARQTEETLENIRALIGEDNLAKHGLPGFGTDLDGLGLVRAYVKNVEDYPAIRAVCEKRLGTRPILYAIGDVCRDDLLVELEGIAHSTRASTAG